MAIKQKIGNPTLLQVAIPANRGKPEHHERSDGQGITHHIGNKVVSIHTPYLPIIRAHELMHARHTFQPQYDRDYDNVSHPVAEIIEDCRLHLHHWPWKGDVTPDRIATSAQALMAHENDIVKMLPAPWYKFITDIRHAAVNEGLTGVVQTPKDPRADRCLELIRQGRPAEAARIMAKLFPDVDSAGYEMGLCDVVDADIVDEDDGIPVPPSNGTQHAIMDIIELPLVEPVEGAVIGPTSELVRTTSGPMLFRPALRRPILPQQLFMRRRILEEKTYGAILFDASGSMNINDDVLLGALKKSPMATIAYYSGKGQGRGHLWIFAQRGMRSVTIGGRSSGNDVDGPAMDWLMSHGKPRVMVTDREFCGADDSDTQIERLREFEDKGEIKVYEDYDSFNRRFGK